MYKLTRKNFEIVWKIRANLTFSSVKKLIALVVFLSIFASCESIQSNENSDIYCGIQTEEVNIDLSNDNPYSFPMASEAYGAINDTIRNRMSDTVEFEIFLAAMTKDAIAIYIYAPKNEEYMNTIGCAIMDTQYPDFVPDQRYMLYYSYAENTEASMPLEIAIKRQ